MLSSAYASPALNTGPAARSADPCAVFRSGSRSFRAVVLDRRIEAVLHVLEVALERRGAKSPSDDCKTENDTILRPFQELVDLVEALETFHCPPAGRNRALTPISNERPRTEAGPGCPTERAAPSWAPLS